MTAERHQIVNCRMGGHKNNVLDRKEPRLNLKMIAR
jgi:hypothetical protein